MSLAKIKKDFGTNTGIDGKYLDSYVKKENEGILERTETAIADKRYDDSKTLDKLEKMRSLANCA